MQKNKTSIFFDTLDPVVKMLLEMKKVDTNSKNVKENDKYMKNSKGEKIIYYETKKR